MANTKYCMGCGAPNDFGANFCMKCGATFSVANTQPQIRSNPQPLPRPLKKAPARTIQDDNDYNEEDEITSVPVLEKLDIEISLPRRTKAKIGDIAGTPQTGFSRPMDRALTKEEAVQQLAKEGGSLKRGESAQIGD